jgi:hypothetical protein
MGRTRLAIHHRATIAFFQAVPVGGPWLGPPHTSPHARSAQRGGREGRIVLRGRVATSGPRRAEWERLVENTAVAGP